MLIKEYRICLPMSVEEYRIAQLYMIQKKSRLESRGEGSRVEILTNEPYDEGPGGTGSGQHTFKLYHIDQHIPGWFRVLLPDSACTVEEEAWNAYPYTCTRYTCPFIKHFSLEIETVYRDDAGQERNVFNLPPADLSRRTVDIVDVVQDSLQGADYVPEEDPRLYRSVKTGRGPLDTDWLEGYKAPKRRGAGALDKPIMCSYKLCRVNFPYWGFQGKIERFVHDIGLRKTILRAHRQAWCWQDEYHGLTIEDIRRLERETQLALQSHPQELDPQDQPGGTDPHDSPSGTGVRGASDSQGGVIVPQQTCRVSASAVNHSPVGGVTERTQTSCTTVGVATDSSSLASQHTTELGVGSSSQSGDSVGGARYSLPRLQIGSDTGSISTPVTTSMTSMTSLTPTTPMISLTSARRFSRAPRMSMISTRDLEPMIELLQATQAADDSEEEEEEFFDACGELPDDSVNNTSRENLSSLSSSLISLVECGDPVDHTTATAAAARFSTAAAVPAAATAAPRETAAAESVAAPNVKPCVTDILIIVVHGGTTVDSGLTDQLLLKQADLATFQTTFRSVLRSLYPSAVGKIALRLVTCPGISAPTISLLARLNPEGNLPDTGAVPGSYSTTSILPDLDSLIHPDLLSGTLPIMLTSSPGYERAVEEVTVRANGIYRDFLTSEEGKEFCGQVYMVGDSLGSLIAYDILCHRQALNSLAQQQLDHLSLYEESELSVSDSRGFLSSQSGNAVQRASSCRSANERASCFRAASERARSFKFRNIKPKRENSDGTTLSNERTDNVKNNQIKNENSENITEVERSTSFKLLNAQLQSKTSPSSARDISTQSTSEHSGVLLANQSNASFKSQNALHNADSSAIEQREAERRVEHCTSATAESVRHLSSREAEVKRAANNSEREDKINPNSGREFHTGGREFHTGGSVRRERQVQSDEGANASVKDPGKSEMDLGLQTEPGSCLDFGVSELFMLGSPIGLVLAHRKLSRDGAHSEEGVTRPACRQTYNLYYSASPTALRLEPLLYPEFTHIPSVQVPKYSSKYSQLGSQPNSLVDAIMTHRDLLAARPPDGESRDVTKGGHFQTTGASLTLDDVDTELEALFTELEERWWGEKRLDYCLHCPVYLRDLPSSTLSHVLHAGFWESNDAVAFLLRQILNQDAVLYRGSIASETQRLGDPLSQLIASAQPTESWIKKRTALKVKNLSPNHRANDILVAVDQPQTLAARFMYGPLDMVSLSGEKVDIYVVNEHLQHQQQQQQQQQQQLKQQQQQQLKQQQQQQQEMGASSSCALLGSTVTDGAGRAVFEVPAERLLPEGIHHVYMVVRGDHSRAELKLSVLPPRTETVVFSIDGSFAASVSLSGTDPKVRPGAVDVVRHWSELDYLVLYVSARPDVQQRKVVDWLAQHRFPRGMVAFIDRLTTDPLRQKALYLKQLVNEAQIRVQAAYGSAKDLAVYQYIDLPASRTFIVGKLPRKHRGLAVELTDGYPAHLNDLASSPLSRQAVISLRLAPRRLGCFTASVKEVKRGRPVQKTSSLPSNAPSPASTRSRERKLNTSEVLTPGECVRNATGSISDSVRSDSVSANCCDGIRSSSSCRDGAVKESTRSASSNSSDTTKKIAGKTGHDNSR